MISAQINRLGTVLLLIFVIIGTLIGTSSRTGCKDTHIFRNKKEKSDEIDDMWGKCCNFAPSKKKKEK